MLICTKCKISKDESNFCRNRKKKNGLDSWCRLCKKEYMDWYYSEHKEKWNTEKYSLSVKDPKLYDKERHRKDWRKRALKQARRRAKNKGLPYDKSLIVEDIIGFENCECCGKKMIIGELHSTKDSPTLDKIVPSLGYVRGNVVALCSRCNMIKQDATADEIQAVADFIRRVTKKE